MRRTSTAPGPRIAAALGPAVLGALLLAAGHASGQPAAPAAPASGPGAIAADDLRRLVGALAHDSMRGRETPSRELERAAAYVAERFRSFGLRPGLGEDGYQQRFPLTVVRPGDAAGQEATLTGPGGDVRLEPDRDFVAAPTGRNASAAAPLRLWHARRGSSPGRQGILLVPVRPATVGGRLPRVREALRGSRAAGALIVVDGPEGYFEDVHRFFGSEQVSLGEPDALAKPVVLVRRAALPDGLGAVVESPASGPERWRARLSTDASVEGARASNTIGWIRGSDPDLRNEYVIFAAHLDHLGVGRPSGGDSIYNGADDDASGVAAVLELAEAFARADRAPRRSLVFVTFSGEEKGLLGSRWYAEHPVFGLERTVAVFNMDMIGRNWRDTVAAVGKELSSLGGTAERVARRHPELGLAVVGDRWPEQDLFSRSDHYPLARKGVPSLFFFSGLHEDYHQPSDEAHKLAYDKTARIVRLVYLTGRAVADAGRAPVWDPEARARVVEDAP